VLPQCGVQFRVCSYDKVFPSCTPEKTWKKTTFILWIFLECVSVVQLKIHSDVLFSIRDVNLFYNLQFICYSSTFFPQWLFFFLLKCAFHKSYFILKTANMPGSPLLAENFKWDARRLGASTRTHSGNSERSSKQIIDWLESKMDVVWTSLLFRSFAWIVYLGHKRYVDGLCWCMSDGSFGLRITCRGSWFLRLSPETLSMRFQKKDMFCKRRYTQ
jgi:hypothetical protein